MDNIEVFSAKAKNHWSTLKRKTFFLSVNHEKALNILLMIAILSIAINWILQYKTIDGNLYLSYRISGQSENDQPWLPPQFKYPSVPLLGVHHFGDWELMGDYARMREPYSAKLVMPAITPPVGLLITRIFTLGGIGIGYSLYLVVVIILLLQIIRNFRNTLSAMEKTILFALTSVFSLPVIFAFDRGAVHLGAFILIGIALERLNKAKEWPGLLCFLIAISFKPYLIFFLILPLALRKIRFVAKVIFATVLSNLFVLATLYTSNPFTGIKNYATSIVWYQHLIEDNILRSVSGLSFLSKIVEIREGRTAALRFYTHILPSYGFFTCLIFIAAIFISRKFQAPLELRVILLLAISSLLVSDSYSYTLTWSSIALIVWIKMMIQMEENGESLPSKKINLIIMTLLCSVMSPCFIVIAYSYPYGLYLLHDILYVPLIILLLTTFLWSYRKKPVRLQA